MKSGAHSRHVASSLLTTARVVSQMGEKIPGSGWPAHPDLYKVCPEGCRMPGKQMKVKRQEMEDSKIEGGRMMAKRSAHAENWRT